MSFFLIENATELVEAKIIGVIMDIHVHNEDILASLASVKRLSLDFSPLKVRYLFLVFILVLYTN